MAKNNIVTKGLEIPVGIKNLTESQMAVLRKTLSSFGSDMQKDLTAKISIEADPQEIKQISQQGLKEFNRVLKGNGLELFSDADFEKCGGSFEELGRIAAERFSKAFNVSGQAMDVVAKTIRTINTQVKKSLESTMKYGSKTIDELQEAADRYVSGGKKSQINRINDSLNPKKYRPIYTVTNGQATLNESKAASAVQNLFKIYNENIRLRQNPKTKWDQQYASDVSLARAYGSVKSGLDTTGWDPAYIFKENLDQFNEIGRLVDQMAYALEDKVNMLKNIQTYDPNFKGHFKYGYNAGEPWAREGTLLEIKSILENGIKVDGSTKNITDQPDVKDTAQIGQQESPVENVEKKLEETARNEENIIAKAKEIIEIENKIAAVKQKQRLGQLTEKEGDDQIASLNRTALDPKKDFLKLSGRKWKDASSDYNQYRQNFSTSENETSQIPTIVAYRGLRHEGSKKIKKKLANYWAEEVEIAKTYTDEMGSFIARSNISSKTPMIIDAHGGKFNDFKQMTVGDSKLTDLLPELLSSDEENSRSILEKYAQKIGADAIITKNVIDDFEAASETASTTISVIDESIIEINDGFMKLKDGTFVPSEVPSWYKKNGESIIDFSSKSIQRELIGEFRDFAAEVAESGVTHDDERFETVKEGLYTKYFQYKGKNADEINGLAQTIEDMANDPNVSNEKILNFIEKLGELDTAIEETSQSEQKLAESTTTVAEKSSEAAADISKTSSAISSLDSSAKTIVDDKPQEDQTIIDQDVKPNETSNVQINPESINQIIETITGLLESNKLSINTEGLREILESITYTVRLIQDGNNITGIISRLSDPSFNKEYLGILNSITGKISDEHFIGKENSASGTFNNINGYDTMFHNHPNVSTAIPSLTDWQTFLAQFDNFKRQIIITKDEISTLDFSKLKIGDLKAIVDEIDAALKDAKPDKEFVKNAERFGKNEATQILTKNATQDILSKYPGIMQTYSLQNSGKLTSYLLQLNPQTERQNTDRLNDIDIDIDKFKSIFDSFYGYLEDLCLKIQSIINTFESISNFDGTKQLNNDISQILTNISSEFNNIIQNINSQIENIINSIKIPSQNKKGPWALESTLSTIIKQVLLDIKTDLDQLNQKIVRGTKTIEVNKKSNKGSSTTGQGGSKSKTKSKDGTITHGEAEGTYGSINKKVDYYYWLQEQKLQFAKNKEYISQIEIVLANLRNNIAEFGDDWIRMLDGEKIDPATLFDKDGNSAQSWLPALQQKHDLHMSRISGEQDMSESIKYQKNMESILMERARLEAEISRLKEKGATEEDLAPLKERLELQNQLKNILRESMTDEEYYNAVFNAGKKEQIRLSKAEEKAIEARINQRENEARQDAKIAADEAKYWAEKEAAESEAKETTAQQEAEMWRKREEEIAKSEAKEEAMYESRAQKEIEAFEASEAEIAEEEARIAADEAEYWSKKEKAEEKAQEAIAQQEAEMWRKREEEIAKSEAKEEAMYESRAQKEIEAFEASEAEIAEEEARIAADEAEYWSKKEKAEEKAQEAIAQQEAEMWRKREEEIAKSEAKEEAAAEASFRNEVNAFEAAEEEIINKRKQAVRERTKALETESQKLAKLYADRKLAEEEGHRQEVGNIDQEILKLEEKIKIAEKEAHVRAGTYIKRAEEESVPLYEAKAAKRTDKERIAAFKRQAAQERRKAGVNKGASAYNGGQETITELQQVEGLTDEIIIRVEKYKDVLKQLWSEYQILSQAEKITNKQSNSFRNLVKQVKDTKREFDALLAKQNDIKNRGGEVLVDDADLGDTVELRQKYMENLATSLTKGKAQIQSYNDTEKTLTYTLEDGKHQLTTYTLEFDKLGNAVYRVRGQTQKMPTLIDEISAKVKQLSHYFTGTMLIYRAIAKARQGVQTVKEIDAALVELRKVTNETEETYRKFIQTASELGQKIGGTITDVTQATATFAKLGYSIKDATKMAESALVYKNVGDGIESADAAAESIISTLKAFSIEAENSMSIVDKFNETGNNFAISSKGVGDALTRSASALSAANNTLDESIGLITAANTVVQDPEAVGTALKTLSLRLRGTKTELQEASLDTDNMANSVSSLQKKLLALSHGKVDIMADADTYKSTTQVIREMANAWQDMTDIERAAALELMGGKRQANILSAMIQNFDIVEDVIDKSANSAGSGLKENEKILESISGRINLLNNQVQSMWNTWISSDLVKFFTTILTSLAKIGKEIGLLPSLGLIGIFGGMIKQKKLLLPFLSSVGESISIISEKIAKTTARVGKATGKFLNIFTRTGKASEAATIATRKFDKAQIQAALSTAGVTAEETKQIIKDLKLAKTKNDLTRATLLNSDAFQGLSLKQRLLVLQQLGLATSTDALKLTFIQLGETILNLAPILGAVAGYFITNAIMDHIKTMEDLDTEYNNLSDSLQETKDKIQDLQSQLDDTNDQMDELLNKDNLTFVEEEELSRLRQVNSELRTQMSLERDLEALQQKQLNNQAKTNIREYKKIGLNSGKTSDELGKEKINTGRIVGGAAGYALGSAAGAALGAKIGGTAGTFMGPIGTVVGILLGALIGTGVAMIAGKVESATEDKLGDELTNLNKIYKEKQNEYDKIESKYYKGEVDKSELEDAREEFEEYSSKINEYLLTLSQYYNSIDKSLISDAQELKAIKQGQADVNDQISAIAIQNNDPNAVSDAIERILSEEEELIQYRKEIVQKIKDGDKIKADDILSRQDQKDVMERFTNIGISGNQLLRYFEDLASTAKESEKKSDIVGMVGDIGTIEDAMSKISSAMSEMYEKGIISPKTLKDLQELQETTGSLDDEWDNFIEAVAGGNKTLQEAQGAASDLVFGIISNAITTEGIDAKELIPLISQLRTLGVNNPTEVIDEVKLQKAIDNIAIEYNKKVNRVMSGQNSHGENIFQAVTNVAKDGTILSEDELQEAWDKYIRTGENELGIIVDIDGFDYSDASVEDIQAYLNDNPIEIYVNTNEANYLDSLIAKYEEIYKIKLTGEQKTGLLEKANEAQRAKNAYEQLKNERAQQIEEEESAYREKDNLESEFEDFKKRAPSNVIGNSATIEEAYEYAMNQSKWGYISSNTDIVAFNELTELAKKYGEVKNQINDLKDVEIIPQDDIDKAKEKVDELEKELKEKFGESFEAKIEFIADTQKIDDLQGIFDQLSGTIKEFNENGYITVDTFQSLLELSPKYLTALYDENGNLKLNKEALLEVAQAQIFETTQKQIDNIISEATLAVQGNEIKKLKELTEIKYGAADAQDKFNTSALAGYKIALASSNLNKSDQDKYYNGIVDQINSIIDLYNRAAGSITTLEDSFSSSGNTAKQETKDAYEKEMAYWENRLSANESRRQQVQNEIDMLEKQGKTAGAEYYQELNKLDEERMNLLDGQQAAAYSFLNAFEEGSDDWWTAAKQINSIEDETDKLNQTMQDLSDTIAKIKWDVFDEFNTRTDDLHGQLSDIRDLIDDDLWFDEFGSFTDKGAAELGTYVQDYYIYAESLKNVRKEMTDFAKGYKGNEKYFKDVYSIDSEQEYYDMMKKLYDEEAKNLKGMQDSQNGAMQIYRAQVEAIQKYTDKLKEYYSEYINNVKEALSAERDLHDFKKNIEEQTKSIAETERKISALQNSTNASDIAQRRKLEKELYDQKDKLNETYYDKSISEQEKALDEEDKRYSKTLDDYVKTLNETLDEAKKSLDIWFTGITETVTGAAGPIADAYSGTGLTLDNAIVKPWNDAQEAINKFGTDKEGGLSALNAWCQKGGGLYTFSTNGSKLIQSPFNAGGTAANAFKTSTQNAMSGVYEAVRSNVEASLTKIRNLSTEVSGVYSQILDTEQRAENLKGKYQGVEYTHSDNWKDGDPEEDVGHGKWKSMMSAKLTLPDGTSHTIYAYGKTGYDSMQDAGMGAQREGLSEKVEEDLKSIFIQWYKKHNRQDLTNDQLDLLWNKKLKAMKADGSYFYSGVKKYASGTLKTRKDELAITDESWIGDEITLAAGKNGQLQYLKKGSAVMPADISANLVEWGKISPSKVNLYDSQQGVNMMCNAISQPEYNFNIEKFLSVDRVDQETLPEVKKFVHQELDNFVKKMNYSLKKVGAY